MSQPWGILWFYADDILLLSASRTGLQEMVQICIDAVKQRNLSFVLDFKIH